MNKIKSLANALNRLNLSINQCTFVVNTPSVAMTFQRLLDSLNRNPGDLFLIDGFGAIVSAFLLGIVFVRLESLVGIPTSTLYLLAILPCMFALYDLLCFLVSANPGIFLKGIASLNITFCCISIGLAWCHHNTITYFGWAYILLETTVIFALVRLELRLAG